jgi:chorismate-pyruvate lyase
VTATTTRTDPVALRQRAVLRVRILPVACLVGALLPAAARAGDLAQALLKSPSATAVLQARCDRISSARIRITAEQLRDAGAPPALDVHRLLDLPAADPVVLRHVRLHCGTMVLSEAWNWYAPERLTPMMNETLERTETPFGRAVAATHFTRTRIASVSLDPRASGGMTLQNTAVLHRASDDAPIALVVERYDERVPAQR